MRNRILAFLLVAACFPAAERRQEPDTYLIWLEAPPVGLRLPPGRSRLAAAELTRLAAEVETTQQPVRRALEQRGLTVTGSVRHLLNGVFVEAAADQAQSLQSIGGVRGVVRMRRLKPRLNASADLINAPAAWTALGGVSRAGAGVKIAILDSGIDHTHAGLQDPTLTPPAGYPKGQPEDLRYTHNKIIVARSYLRPATIDPRFTRPDDYSARDRAGHGTFIAMAAAGRRVAASGGPTITGVAPAAFLGNYKVLGSTDLNDFVRQSAVLQAMDDAVSDDMDILNLSLGGIALFAPSDRGAACSTTNLNAICDPLAEAARIATEQFGILVVTAAGNDGDRGNVFPTLNAISSPASAAAAVAVAATTNSRQLFSTLRGGAGAPASLRAAPMLFGNGPRPERPLAAAIRAAESAGNDGFACEPLRAGAVQGLFVLVRRGNCDFEDKVIHAAAGGAQAVVISNRQGRNTPIIMTGLVSATIPAVMVGDDVGTALRGWIGSTANATVTLDPALTGVSTAADLAADYTSRGPGIDMELKPDVSAPGTLFSATQSWEPNGSEYDPTGFTTLEGTSFAAPLVAGAAALAWQNNPNLTAAQVKSAVVNTASGSVTEEGQPARSRSVGAGKLDAQAALNPGATAEPVSLSFGSLTASSRFPVTRELRVTNVGRAADTFRLEIEQRDSDSNARVRFGDATSASVQLNPGQSARATVSLLGSQPRPGIYEGVIRVRGSAASLRVPYHYLAGSGRPAGIFPIAGDGSVGTAGRPLPALLIFKLVDEFGVPTPNVDVQFRVTQGGGRIEEADARTDRYGIAAADVDLGPAAGDQSYSATAAGLTVDFFTGARAEPKISAGGVVNGASFARDRKVAPGAIISIFGSDLAEATRGAIRLPLPLALYQVSVSFDQPDAGVSVPGRLFFVSPGQLNVQVPWELRGLTFAALKVRIADTTSAVYRLELSDYAPGIFEYQLGGQKLAVATHADGQIITPSSPARPGETVIVYATGVGPVDQPQASGEAASAQPLARTQLTPTATLEGQGAAVLFSGLAPFFVGLSQINLTIPSGARSGVQPLVITSNGIDSNTVSLPVQ